MDYEIAFDQDENLYRISTGYEFAAIGEWVSEYVRDLENIQRVLLAARLAEIEKEVTQFKHGPFEVIISEEGVAVTRLVDMDAADEEIKAMFDSQESFYQTSTDGIQAECGLEDLVGLIEDWHQVLQ
ncbi:YacL family protein [Marinomonas transparens]|uniref:YacL family protein n=1 Tax=Marinomonas transparens TaxID=2795388 RepID=A0A934JS52_9GAMM|nr:YacL family protein [Marinomonas transparens]MBJ7538878.1 YacL family protein [Marinomonas transparens]